MLVFHTVNLVVFLQVLPDHFAQNPVAFTMKNLQGTKTHHNCPVKQTFYSAQGVLGAHTTYINLGTKAGNRICIGAKVSPNLFRYFFFGYFMDLVLFGNSS